MHKSVRELRATVLIMTLVLAVGARADVVETRMLEEVVPVDDASGFEVTVDNVFGSIVVIAESRSNVTMTATETIRADSQTDLERAREEVGLRTERESERVGFLVRQLDDTCDCECRCRGLGWRGYTVSYDIELHVPFEVTLDLSTVNDGEIVVDDARGDFRAENVNGPVTLRRLRGAGHASTVNGRLEATFERVPSNGSSFETINGEIDVAFPSDLSADLQFRTMRGTVWTDFDATPLPSDPVSEQTRDGARFVIRAERRSGVRVASGGPVHSFDTMNGDIYVRELRQ